MSPIFATQDMFVKNGEEFQPIIVKIYQPMGKGDGLFYCRVEFCGFEKFNAIIRGADSINCLECAIVYIKGIYRESEHPRFYLEEDEPYIDV